MTKANITQYDSTPSNNADINDINIAENCPASNINNAIRELMAHLKNVDTGSQALTALSVTGATTLTGALTGTTATLTTADNTDQLSLVSTDTDANQGPNLRMYRNSASPADNDLLGYIEFEGRNDASEDVKLVQLASQINDVSDGTEDGSFYISSMVDGTLRNRVNFTPTETVFNEESRSLDFRIEANGVANMFYVDGTNQKVKVKTSSQVSTSSAETFAVDAGTLGGYAGVFSTQTVGGFACLFLKTNSDVSNFIYFMRDTSVVGSITTNGSTTSFNTTSDHRLKENVTYDFDATSRLKQLKPCRFNFIGQKETVDGFLAHEVTAVPEAITGEKDAMTKEVLYVDGDEIPEGKKVGDVKEASKIDPQGIDQSKLVPLLTKALQEQQATIEALEARITALESA